MWPRLPTKQDAATRPFLVRPTPCWPSIRVSSNWATRPTKSGPSQPLLTISGGPAIGANPALTFGAMADFDRILPACAAMFEEEVGYSPFLGGQEFYSRRVAGLIRQGHSLVHIDAEGTVVFKAELGAVTRGRHPGPGRVDESGIPGTRPERRLHGRRRESLRTFAPVTSLYVNDYNAKARATYERVGFEQVGTFATVLF